MPETWSRRGLLAGFAGALAGCATAGNGRSPERGRPDGAGTPDWTTGVERRSAEDPALAWAARVPHPSPEPPAVDPSRGLVYVGTGESSRPPPAGEGPGGGRLFALRAGDGAPVWRSATTAPVTEPPVVAGGRVHAMTGYTSGYRGIDQRILAYGPDGTHRWSTEPRSGFISVVAADDRYLFAGTSDDNLSGRGERLFAVGDGGGIGWARDAGDALGGTLTGGKLLYAAGFGAMAAYDPASGEREWRATGNAVGNPATAITTAGGLCFTESPGETESGSGSGYPLVARATGDGSERWRYADPPGSGDTFVLTGVAALAPPDGDPPDGAVVGTEFGGSVFALGAENGRELWTHVVADDTREGPVVGDAVYVSDAAGTVYALDPSEGRERWRVSLPAAARLRPLSRGVLCHARTDGESTVTSVDENGDRRWTFTAAKRLTPPVVAGDRAYACGPDGTVLAFSLGGGR